jgi:hypothetical protein
MLFSDFQEARTAAQRAAQETGQSVTLTRQGDGWVVEAPDASKLAEPSPTAGEIPWDSGEALNPDEEIPF